MAIAPFPDGVERRIRSRLRVEVALDQLRRVRPEITRVAEVREAGRRDRRARADGAQLALRQLKGGLVLELRLERARTTKDVDLRLAGPSSDVLPRLQEAGALDLGDFMQFEVAPDPDIPEIVGDGVQYDGYRFRAECRLAGKVYGARFAVDVVFGGVLSGDVEEIVTEDVLGFAGIAPPRLNVVPIETHLAEKLHAYTLPRERPNTRVKDLPDLALLGTVRALDATRIRAGFARTFDSRRVQPVPARLPVPPQSWATPYARMAEVNALPVLAIAENREDPNQPVRSSVPCRSPPPGLAHRSEVRRLRR